MSGKIAMILGIAIGLWLAWWYYAAVAADGAAYTNGRDVTSAQRAAPRPTPVVAPAGDATRTRLEAMDENELKRFYAHCSQQGIERRLDGGEAMTCSVGYDVLLQKHFGGDFKRLLAWSRSCSEAAPR